jgi:hypothetical protein
MFKYPKLDFLGEAQELLRNILCAPYALDCAQVECKLRPRLVVDNADWLS